MKYSSLIIGLGNIGMGYDLESNGDTRMTHTGACISHNSISEIYGVDPDLERRKLFEKITGSKAFANIAELKKTITHIDLCIISTPTSLRKNIINECISLTPKAVLVEKPLSESKEEADTIKAICDGNKIPLYVNYIRNFDPVLKGLKKRINENEFGMLCAGKCCFSGTVLNIASHYISLLLEWFGSPEKVTPISTGKFLLEYPGFNFSFEAVPDTNYSVGEITLWFPEYKILLNRNCMNAEISSCIQDPVFPVNKSLVLKETLSADLLNYQYNVIDSIVLDMMADNYESSSLDNAYMTLELSLKVI
jgi:hypothetical protein